MKSVLSLRNIPQERKTQAMALGVLLLLGGFALIGPSGVLAWRENVQMLQHREAELKNLTAEQEVLKNKAELLNPRDTDPDLAGELLHSQLNVVHPDDMVMMLKPKDQ